MEKQMILDFLNQELFVGDRIVLAAADRNPKLISGTITAITPKTFPPIVILTDSNRVTCRKGIDVLKHKENNH